MNVVELKSKLKSINQKTSEHAVAISGTQDSQTSFAISCLLENTDSRTVIVCENDKKAENLFADLNTFQPDSAVLFFPKRRVHASISIMLDENLSGERLAALSKFRSKATSTMIGSIEAFMQKTAPRAWLEKHTLHLKVHDQLDFETIGTTLNLMGYQKTPLVYEPGQFAIRGSVVDVFTELSNHPFRLEFFDDEIESIRTFDSMTQTSLEKVDGVALVPNKEFIAQTDFSKIKSRLKNRCESLEIPFELRFQMESLLEKDPSHPALEDIFTCFFDTPENVWNYLDGNDKLFVVGDQEIEIEAKKIKKSTGQAKSDADSRGRVFDPEIYDDVRVIKNRWQEPHTVFLESLFESPQSIHIDAFFNPPVLASSKERMHFIEGRLESGMQVQVYCVKESQMNRVEQLLDDAAKRVSMRIGNLQSAFSLSDVWFIPDSWIFGISHPTKRPRKTIAPPADAIMELFAEGSFIVHLDHGIGKFLGLEHLEVGGVEGDFAKIAYAEGDTLYLPIYRLHLIQSYLPGDEDSTVALDRLGSGKFELRKRSAKKAMEEMAKDLLRLYAERKIVEGFAFSERDPDFMLFEASFPYEETRDQEQAIEDVLSDMAANRPMDRLICGDVGFGKTEVAMRGACRAVLDGKQVAVLVPTTLLARQHAETFRERFSDIAVRIDCLSRFQTAKEQRVTLESCKNGQVDILIGTHRLLSSDLEFSDLGLLIIDEEHRFGVRQKDKIRALRSKIDVLTLTATPIPRTLQMSLYGFRDLSIIETPPVDRKPIETYLARFDEQVIRTAILKELKRGGQVFFVHNRVKTMPAILSQLRKIVPEATHGMVHGEMPKVEIEKVMLKFMRHDVHVLIASAIIESGLDFPNANTMIVNRADYFGLAQLYQLRGRVGRSDKNAFSYLLIPGEDLISTKAAKRLKALRSFTHLGSGYRIAMRDLEIRGAGNLLGTKQSGNIRSLGIELYSDMLNKTIQELRGESIEDEMPEPEISVPISAFIPESYIGDKILRLSLYRRVAGVQNQAERQHLEKELRDRFGQAPPPVEHLFDTVTLRNAAARLGILKIGISTDFMTCQFAETTPLRPDRLLAFIASRPDAARMVDAKTLKLHLNRTDKPLKVAVNLLNELL